MNVLSDIFGSRLELSPQKKVYYNPDLWGIIVSFVSGSNSATSYIPSFLGFPLFVFSYLAIKFPLKKKLFMHIVVIFIFLMFRFHLFDCFSIILIGLL